MTITFIVYSALLGPSDIGGPEPWVNFIVHFLAPLAVLADWVVVPARTLPGKTAVVAWLAWPVIWATYTLMRGAAAGLVPVPVPEPARVGRVCGSPRLFGGPSSRCS